MANGNGKWKTYLTVFGAFVVIGGWLVTWGQTTSTIDTLKEQVKENKVARDTTIKLDSDVQHIKENQQEIKEAIKEQDKKLDKILEKLNG